MTSAIDNPYAIVSCWYGLGVVGSWYLLTLSCLITSILNPNNDDAFHDAQWMIQPLYAAGTAFDLVLRWAQQSRCFKRPAIDHGPTLSDQQFATVVTAPLQISAINLAMNMCLMAAAARNKKRYRAVMVTSLLSLVALRFGSTILTAGVDVPRTEIMFAGSAGICGIFLMLTGASYLVCGREAELPQAYHVK